MLHATPLTFLLSLSIAGAAGATVSGGRDARPWPLPIDINLSSSFGEYRSGHLHAGVDIRTFGREGVECRAVGDGYVSRMRASPSGYGKALYLKLRSGETVVYAHLSEFAPGLEDALYEAQLAEGRYQVDTYYDADRLPVRRGDVIAYTGSTGTSAPHLHFEVRDDRENPMNPLSLGWELEDHAAAVFQGAMWMPLSAASRIEGRCQPYRPRLRPAGANHWVAADTVAIAGHAGIGVYVVDRINSSSGKLAPYSVEMTVDGVALASVALESFNYGHAGEVSLAYDMERVRADGQYYLLLFRRPGETLWHRTFVNDGIIDTDLVPTLVGENKASYTIVVRASDRAGNVATLSLPFRIRGTSTARDTREVVDAGSGRLPGCYFFNDFVSIRSAAAEFAFMGADGAEIYGINGPDQLAFSAVDLFRDIADPWPSGGGVHNGHRPGTHAVLPRDASTPRRYVIPLRAGERQRKALADIGVEIVAEKSTLYGDAIVYLGRWGEPQPLRSHARRTFDFAFPAVELGPLSLPLRKPMELRFTQLERGTDTRAAVYQLDEKQGEWSYETSEVHGDTVSAWVGGPGVYAVLVDRVPPRISQPTPAKRRSYATGLLAQEITIPIDDDGCGVDDQRTVVSIDGRRQIARWDSFAKTMTVTLRDADHHGSYRVAVVAYDHVGNEAAAQARVNIRK